MLSTTIVVPKTNDSSSVAHYFRLYFVVNGNQKCSDFGNSECSIFGIKTTVLFASAVQ